VYRTQRPRCVHLIDIAGSVTFVNRQMKNRSRPVTLSLGFGITPKAKIVKGSRIVVCLGRTQGAHSRGHSGFRNAPHHSTRLAVARYAVEAVEAHKRHWIPACETPHLVITDSQLGNGRVFLDEGIEGRCLGCR